jgi:hypothetical protein
MKAFILKFSEYLSIDMWKAVLSNDFNRGYIAALVLMISIFILLFVLKLFCFIIFRKKRASKVVVPSANGDMIIAHSAVAKTVEISLRAYPELDIEKVKLYTKGKNYFMTIFCGLSVSMKRNLPEISNEIKPLIQKKLADVFGIENIKEIDIIINYISTEDELSKDDNDNVAKEYNEGKYVNTSF